MENNKEDQKQKIEQSRYAEWGAHNPKLKDENFIDRVPKKIADTDELLANVDSAKEATAIEESGRDRPGTKEGESSVGP